MTPLNRRRTTDRTIVIPVKTGIQNKTLSRSDSSILNSSFLIHNCLFPSPGHPERRRAKSCVARRSRGTRLIFIAEGDSSIPNYPFLIHNCFFFPLCALGGLCGKNTPALPAIPPSHRGPEKTNPIFPLLPPGRPAEKTNPILL